MLFIYYPNIFGENLIDKIYRIKLDVTVKHPSH